CCTSFRIRYGVCARSTSLNTTWFSAFIVQNAFAFFVRRFTRTAYPLIPRVPGGSHTLLGGRRRLRVPTHAIPASSA
ncbi:hypothetical protein ABLN86_02770, partial [Mycobacterium tuberculosis]